MRRFLSALVVGFLALHPRPARADEGWLIERLDIRFTIERGGSVVANEAFDVDFKGLSRHGILRDLRYLLEYDARNNREYAISVIGVTSADGRRHLFQTETEGSLRRFRIGDPDRTISGRETYRIAYRIAGALNGFADHDEFYWNATGTWPVRVQSARVTVVAPDGAIDRVECFQGPAGSRERCDARLTAGEAAFTATRPLAENEQLTIVTSLRKGVVAVPPPLLVARPRGVTGFFEWTPELIIVSFAGLLGALGGVGALWWHLGREEQSSFFWQDPVAVQFEPPDGMRPAQMGLLLDESADTLDVTATIVDLAVRGYVTITEIPSDWWFGRTDWQLERLKPPDSSLLEYERIVLRGLFETTTSRKISELKNKFYDDLALARKELYREAVARGWFPHNPNTIRLTALWIGLGLAAVGVWLTIALGRQWGAGLLGLPVVAGGFALAMISRAMPRRTAEGREATRRVRGFAKYIQTAEVRQQAFAERANVFTSYLPYAVAFKCVDKWAHAFKDIDMQQAAASWYAGSSSFDSGEFSSTLASFSTSLSKSITSTPGGSGGSGLSGGSSGGGGGGGGGGSW